MRRAVAFCSALFPIAALAQGGMGAPPSPPGPAMPAPPIGGAPGQWAGQGAGQAAAPEQQGYAGCYGCSYSGDYHGSNVTGRRPAPPLRLQGQWRNGWWYY